MTSILHVTMCPLSDQARRGGLSRLHGTSKSRWSMRPRWTALEAGTVLLWDCYTRFRFGRSALSIPVPPLHLAFVMAFVALVFAGMPLTRFTRRRAQTGGPPVASPDNSLP